MLRLISFLSAALMLASCHPESEEVTFTSEAKLLVRHPVNRAGPAGGNGQVAADIVNDEMAALESAQLWSEIVKAIGPEKLLGSADLAREDKWKAAMAVQNGLDVMPQKNSNLILLRFRHADPAVAQEVLEHLIQARIEQVAKISGNPHKPSGDLVETLKFKNNIPLEVFQRPTVARRSGR